MRIGFKYFCVLCGAWTKHGPFCPFCEDQFKTRQGCWERKIQGVSVLSLFRWWPSSPKGFDVLSERVKEMKSPLLFAALARKILAEVPPGRLAGRPLIVLPSSTGRTHSLQLAKALSDHLQTPIVSGLELVTPRRQPGLSRKARFKRELKWGASRDSRNYTDVIFVDDVLTTGATMKAALDAVKPSGSALGLTLFSRER